MVRLPSAQVLPHNTEDMHLPHNTEDCVSEQAEENTVSTLKKFDASLKDALQCGIRKVVPNTQ